MRNIFITPILLLLLTLAVSSPFAVIYSRIFALNILKICHGQTVLGFYTFPVLSSE